MCFLKNLFGKKELSFSHHGKAHYIHKSGVDEFYPWILEFWQKVDNKGNVINRWVKYKFPSYFQKFQEKMVKKDLQKEFFFVEYKWSNSLEPLTDEDLEILEGV